jgi:hypothetical protein
MPAHRKRASAAAKRVRKRQSARATMRVRPAPKSISETTAGRRITLPILLANEQDDAVIRRLSTASPGDLPVDKFSCFLREDDRCDDPQSIVNLRFAVIQVYFAAARARDRARAAQWQINLAQGALVSVKAAVTALGDVRPRRQRGIAGQLGRPLDDIKGLDELNQFASKCWKIQLDLVPIAQALDKLLTAETAKPKPDKRGERKKRLRILIEKLAQWWSSATKRSIAPYVQAKRLDHRPAFVLGRRGDFVEFAQALFCEIDEFKSSEVISAITNVHESSLKGVRTK